MAFKLRSGNKTNFKNMGSSPMKQDNNDDECDISKNQLANDEYSSYKTTPNILRINVEKYFIQKYDLKLIEYN